MLVGTGAGRGPVTASSRGTLPPPRSREGLLMSSSTVSPGSPAPAAETRSRTRAVPSGRRCALVLAALGVVFGDIGTSPLYALQTVFSIDHGAVRPTVVDVYGVISLMFWSVTLIVTVKYVSVLMRADNDGEGGVMALAALAQRLYSGRAQRSGLAPRARHRRRRRSSTATR